MDGMLTKITKENRINIPEPIIDKLKWKIDQYLLVTIDDNKIVIYKAKVVIDEN